MTTNAKIRKILEEKAKLIDSRIEKYIPREFGNSSLPFKISPPRCKIDLEALNKAIAEPFWEFLDRGGKRWRPALFILIYKALGGQEEDLLDFAVIPEIIHNGTLIADDIEDDSKLRRGKPCSHELFGLDITINLSSFMYFVPMMALIENRKMMPNSIAQKIYEIYIEEMTNISFGQAIDIAWHKGLIPIWQVSEEEYLQMCMYKTGTLARMSARMASVLAYVNDDKVEKMGKFAESIGVSFQIQDDILDLVGEEFTKRKGGRGMDITEGKLTLMIIHTLSRSEPYDRKKILKILRMHTKEEKLINKAITIINKYGSIDYSKRTALKMVQESWREVDKILLPSEEKNKLSLLVEYLIKRKI
jgi:geranylgeranyl pyrophosphate synthase